MRVIAFTDLNELRQSGYDRSREHSSTYEIERADKKESC